MNAPHVCPVTLAQCDEAMRPTCSQPLRCGITQERAAYMHSCPLRMYTPHPSMLRAALYAEAANVG
jgi:hypothetical protein